MLGPILLAKTLHVESLSEPVLRTFAYFLGPDPSAPRGWVAAAVSRVESGGVS